MTETHFDVSGSDAPTWSEVVVVGGGLVGMCIGLSLLRSGKEVTIVDKGAPGGQASSHNAGIISIGNIVPTGTPGVVKSIPHMLRDPLAPLAIRWSYLPRMIPWLTRFLLSSRRSRVEAISIDISSLMNGALSAYHDLIPDAVDTGLFTRGGHLVTYETEAGFAKGAFSRDLRRRRGVDFEVLGGREIGDLDPALRGRFARAIWFTDALNTDPVKLSAEVALRFTEGGGKFLRAECEDFLKSKTGAIDAVVTNRGIIHSNAVVLSGGAWSRNLARKLRVRVPLDTERGYGVEIRQPNVPLTRAFISADLHLGFNPLADRLLLAGTDELAGLKAPPNFERADRLIDAARTIFPELGTAQTERWMSFRPSLPDSKPILGRAPKYSNAFLAFGHGHVGVTLAAITGKLVTEMVSGERPSIDLEPFRPDRF